MSNEVKGKQINYSPVEHVKGQGVPKAKPETLTAVPVQKPVVQQPPPQKKGK